ncbi:FecR domain-containing protein, partial [Myxococcota bacterium]|nr:FecR domain-containing protein [Myxococcota bacterium]MBU1897596.1 FecR domain-containing protein [Myxococcota bacterium]
RLPVAARVGPEGQRLAEAYAQAIASGGVPKARISTLVPAAGPREAGAVVISFTERRAKRPVARVSVLDGQVTAGPDEAQQRPLRPGDDLHASTLVVTGQGGSTWLDLADGSRVKLLGGSALMLKEMYLNARLARVVRMDLLRGDVEADVIPGTPGATFEITTGALAAGVRGTSFRLQTLAGGTKLETTEGLVELREGAASVPVKAGFGLKVSKGQPLPKAAMPLPPAPKVEGPLRGPLGDAALTWAGFDEAQGYRVDLAQDAEFVIGARSLTATTARLESSALKLDAGKWFWRVSAVNADGLSGPTSKVYAFDWGG